MDNGIHELILKKNSWGDEGSGDISFLGTCLFSIKVGSELNKENDITYLAVMCKAMCWVEEK